MSEEKHDFDKSQFITIDLDFPLGKDGEIKKLKLRRPKARDLLIAKRMPGNSADQEMILFANLCDLPPDIFNEIDLVDYAKVVEANQRMQGASFLA